MEGKKFGGRKKGVPNKSRQDVKDIIDRNVDFDVLMQRMYEAASRPKNPDSAAGKLIMEYRWGKAPQSIDLKTDGHINITVRRIGNSYRPKDPSPGTGTDIT